MSPHFPLQAAIEKEARKGRHPGPSVRPIRIAASYMAWKSFCSTHRVRELIAIEKLGNLERGNSREVEVVQEGMNRDQESSNNQALN